MLSSGAQHLVICRRWLSRLMSWQSNSNDLAGGEHPGGQLVPDMLAWSSHGALGGKQQETARQVVSCIALAAVIYLTQCV
jgi:hypothetical protein